MKNPSSGQLPAFLPLLRGPLAPPDEVAIVSLDRASAHRLELPEDPRYWPRSGRARLIDRLVEAGASVIVFDTFLEREAPYADDIALADAIARSERVVLLAKLIRRSMSPTTILTWRRQVWISAPCRP